MSLFARLLALSDRRVPTEDVLTEVAAHLFRLDWRERWSAGDGEGAVLLRWLADVGAWKGGPAVGVRVETQRTYAAVRGHEGVPDHDDRSRPDVVVTIERPDAREVVFVEAKVGSGEGRLQLPRYAEQLHARYPDAETAQRTLVYLTDGYDPKDASDVCRHASDVRFVQARWRGVWRAVHASRTTAPAPLLSLYDDVLSFLAHLGMDHDLRFSPADALALNRIPDSLRFMEATLRERAPSAARGAPADRLAALLDGRVSKPTLNQIRRHRRYPVYKMYGGSHAAFEVLLGYHFPADGFPQLYLNLGSLPASAGGGDVSRAITSLHGRVSEAGTWGVRDYGSWLSARLEVPVGPLLVGDDHVGSAQRALHGLLNELELIMGLPETAPLPWTAPGEDADEE